MKDYTKSQHRRTHDEYIGAKFNRWTVIRILDALSSNGSVLCEARCECGTVKTVPLAVIRSGKSMSCGCLARELNSKARVRDLTGEQFGRLVATRATSDRYTDGSVVWECKCACGRTKLVSSHLLLSGAVRSCGECGLREESVKAANTIYKSQEERDIAKQFNGARQRCLNPNDKDYPKYGGRGIAICSEWKDDIPKFVEWAKSHGYKKGLTLERNDVNGPYSPDNCTWETNERQAQNRRNTVRIVVNGVTYSRAKCAKLLGIPGTSACRIDNPTLTKMLEDRLAQ